jgi:hypothetical protein
MTRSLRDRIRDAAPDLVRKEMERLEQAIASGEHPAPRWLTRTLDDASKVGIALTPGLTAYVNGLLVGETRRPRGRAHATETQAVTAGIKALGVREGVARRRSRYERIRVRRPLTKAAWPAPVRRHLRWQRDGDVYRIANPVEVAERMTAYRWHISVAKVRKLGN